MWGREGRRRCVRGRLGKGVMWGGEEEMCKREVRERELCGGGRGGGDV